MALSRRCRLVLVLFFILIMMDLAVASISTFVVPGGLTSSRRSRLFHLRGGPAKKKCPIEFEFENYTIITSQCRAPDYPADLCCKALREFACPYAKQLNDLGNDCASTMFSYINLYGHYPAGLFAAKCANNPGGLPCPKKSN